LTVAAATAMGETHTDSKALLSVTHADFLFANIIGSQSRLD
jgi:hypothetical protein